MAEHRRDQAALKRIRPAGVTPLELWDFRLDGRPLQFWLSHVTFPLKLAGMVAALRENPPMEWPSATRARMRSVSHVHLAGGGANRPALVSTLGAQRLNATVAGDPVFGSARAGQRLLKGTQVLCADVGQTSVKLARGDWTWRVERDLVQAPRIDDVWPAGRSEARDSTIGFLTRAIATGANTADALVLALPCEVTDDGACLASSYCWEAPDAGLLDELVLGLGFRPDAVGVLNDAELAAVAATGDDRVPRGETILVLTVGHGVGAALLDPRE